MLRRAIVAVLLLCTAAWGQTASRHFTFHYAFTLKTASQAGQKIRVWIPLAHSDAYQSVRVTSLQGDLPLHREREKFHGNQMLYATGVVNREEYKFAVDYDVIRREHVVLSSGTTPHVTPAILSAAARSRFLAPDKLVPTTGRPAELAAQATAGKSTELDKARAIYEYVLANMRYDKSGTGWGRGDVLYACDAKHGNCTDFHSLFISMARSQGIPARFQIGFPLPDASSGEIAGYHCWAEFYLDGTGWVPIDASEAWQHPEKHDYYFGAHDASRMQFTEGRDLILAPRQHGHSLNYFVYPYAEVNGKEYSNLSMDFSFADEATAGASARRTIRAPGSSEAAAR